MSISCVGFSPEKAGTQTTWRRAGEVVVGLSPIATPAAKADLTVAVAKNPPRPLVLFARKHPDACAAPATPVEVVYSFEELGLEPEQAFSLANPLGGGR